MRTHIIYFCLFNLLFLSFHWRMTDCQNEIEELQQKAVAEQIAVWYVSPEGEKGFKWISEIFEEVAQK